MMAPSFNSDVGAVSPQRKHRPLEIIDENHRVDLSTDHELPSGKIKEAWVKDVSCRHHFQRRRAVAPLQHPVFALVAGGVGVEKTNQENRRDFDFVSSALSEDTHNTELCDKACQDKKLSPSPPQRKRGAVESFKGENLVDDKEQRSQIHENEAQEKEPVENNGSFPVCFQKGLDHSYCRKAKSLNDDVFEAPLDSKSQTKHDLNKDLCAWREKVKESVSLPPLLPNKFRPLRRSVGNYDILRPDQSLFGDNTVGLESCEPTSRAMARFFLHGQRPDYLINPNTLVTKPPGEFKFLYGDMPKISSVVRKYSLQERIARGQDDLMANSRDNARLVAMALGRKIEDTQNILKAGVVSSRSRDLHVSAHEENLQENEQKRSSRVGEEEILRRGPTSSPDELKHFEILKETTIRLKLSTRRASTAAWKAQYVEGLADNGDSTPLLDHCQDDGSLTQERKDKINKSLEFLRQELANIDQQDQELARQFLAIRDAMIKIRWDILCKDHEQLLEDVEDDIEEKRALSGLVDTPTDLFSATPVLRHAGLTRMNIASRKFSTC